MRQYAPTVYYSALIVSHVTVYYWLYRHRHVDTSDESECADIKSLKKVINAQNIAASALLETTVRKNLRDVELNAQSEVVQTQSGQRRRRHSCNMTVPFEL